MDDLKKVPNTPGVYKFFSNYEIIYIGKAKNLRARVPIYSASCPMYRKEKERSFKMDRGIYLSKKKLIVFY